MRYRVTHRTVYTYDEEVSHSVNSVRLLPRDTSYQTVLSAHLEVHPVPDEVVERPDFFGNRSHYLSLGGSFERLEVVSTSEVEVNAPPPPAGDAATRSWEEVAALLTSATEPEALDAAQFAFASPLVAPTPELDAYAEKSFTPGRPLPDAVVELVTRIYTDFEYAPGTTTTTTPAEVVLRARRGVCQDFTHFALACLRGRGLAARYVSGYVENTPANGGDRLRGADASHAWLGVWVPDHGWLDVDPTNNCVVRNRHVTTAWGRDYADVPPLKGVIFWEGRDQRLEVFVAVERVEEP